MQTFFEIKKDNLDEVIASQGFQEAFSSFLENNGLEEFSTRDMCAGFYLFGMINAIKEVNEKMRLQDNPVVQLKQ